MGPVVATQRLEPVQELRDVFWWKKKIQFILLGDQKSSTKDLVKPIPAITGCETPDFIWILSM